MALEELSYTNIRAIQQSETAQMNNLLAQLLFMMIETPSGAVVDLETLAYHLTPDAKHPQSLKDCHATIDILVGQINELKNALLGPAKLAGNIRHYRAGRRGLSLSNAAAVLFGDIAIRCRSHAELNERDRMARRSRPKKVPVEG
jgi:hypothetical protein